MTVLRLFCTPQLMMKENRVGSTTIKSIARELLISTVCTEASARGKLPGRLNATGSPSVAWWRW